MTFSFSRFARTTQPAKTVAAAAQPGHRGPVELQPQQLAQVAGGLPKGGWGGVTTDMAMLPKGGWA